MHIGERANLSLAGLKDKWSNRRYKRQECGRRETMICAECD